MAQFRRNGEGVSAGDKRAIADVAAAFGRVIGRPVQYVQMPWERSQATAGEEYTKMLRWFEDVGYDADLAAVRREHPPLLDFESFLRRAGRAAVKSVKNPTPRALP